MLAAITFNIFEVSYKLSPWPLNTGEHYGTYRYSTGPCHHGYQGRGSTVYRRLPGKECITACIMDTGIRGQSPVPVDIGRQAVAESAGQTLQEVQNVKQEGQALKIMTAGADRLAQALLKQGKIQGIIGLGGSMGTTLSSGVMRSLPNGKRNRIFELVTSPYQ